MTARFPQARSTALLACAGLLSVAVLTQVMRLQERSAPTRLLLAPMIGVVEPCLFLAQPEPAGSLPASLLAKCSGSQGSAAALLEATLNELAPSSQTGHYDLGYTLPIPLLKLFKQQGSDWVIEREVVERIARTIHDSDRPLIMYLFSTHFSAGSPIEAALSADPANLATSPRGPLKSGRYFGADLFNWTFATTQTELTARRLEAIRAVLDATCKLEVRDLAKIRGVTLLGELHHLFPDFERDAGFSTPYLVSDYSDASRQGFRTFLRERFGSVGALNQAAGGRWAAFDAVNPPDKDIRAQPDAPRAEHIDSFAQGALPVSGWAHADTPPGAPPAQVLVYRNGLLVGRAPVIYNRQDVLQAHPEFGTANTGWRVDLPFKDLRPGRHRIDVFLESGRGGLTHLATRQILVAGTSTTPTDLLPQHPLPASRPATDAVKAYVDLPQDQASFIYNPLVPLWHAFRAQQVVRYLQRFDQEVKHSCLAGTQRYTHQLFPYSNPGWDAQKYAVDASLGQLGGIRLGISLYGEATYGTSFLNWLAGSGHTTYGITEFHPLKALTASELQTVFDSHAAHGARFLSFFLEPRWNGQLVPRGHNPLSIDPGNPGHGSDQLYASVRAVLANAQRLDQRQ